MTFEPYQKIEPMTLDQLRMIAGVLGPIECMVVDLNSVDVTRGCGVITNTKKCLWTKEGKRLTFGLVTGGGYIASLSRDIDPSAPEPKPEVVPKAS